MKEPKDINENSSDNRDLLGDIFGEDAKTKPDKSEMGIVLEPSQIKILKQSWHCENPLLISAYKEDYRTDFPVSDKSADMLDLPKLDEITQSLLCKRHGPKAGKSRYNKLFSQPEKTYENMAFKGQSAARMGLVITAYIQQVLGLMEKVREPEPNLHLLTQMVKDIFAMSVKAMDQTARSGAFHHLIRRKATLVDTGLEDISELNDKFLSLKLSSEGVLGKDFEEKLKSRSETNKQIKDLLPELNRKSSSTTSFKRKSTVPPQVQDAKVAKTDFSSYRIPKVANNVTKTNDDKSGYKSNFKRSGTGRQNFDKKGSNNSFRGNGRSK